MFSYSPVFHRGHMFLNKMYHKKRYPVISKLQINDHLENSYNYCM